MAQAVKVLAEAEAYNGPSLIIGYAPCELHGVKGGMNPVSYTHLIIPAECVSGSFP